MDYKLTINIKNGRGDTLLDKTRRLSILDNILDIDLSELYAEAQQYEIEKGLDIPEPEDLFQ